MDDTIIFAAGDKIGLANEAGISYLNSEYLTRYNKSRLDLKNKSSWKTEGTGASFMGAWNELQNFDPGQTRASVNGIAHLDAADQFLYSISVNDMSGIFSKSLSDGSDSEGHVIHKNNVEFFNMDYSCSTGRLAVSVREESFDRHLALLDVKKGHYHFLTEGDCIDDNPFWSKTNGRVLYYDTCGIAFDPATSRMVYSPRLICRLDPEKGTVEEMVCDEKFDFIKPKEDKPGNLYFIRKPHKEERAEHFTPMDVLLFPFRIVKAIFGWLNFFTMRYSGESLTTKGNNPAKAKEKSPEQIFIEGNLVNAEKAKKENSDAGEPFPGIAPRSWELMKLEPDGKMTTLKKGVLDYDMDGANRIVYSNGIHIVRMTQQGGEEIIGKAPMANNMKWI